MAKGLLQSGRVTNRSRSLAAPCIPRSRTGPPSSGQGHPPLLPIAAAGRRGPRLPRTRLQPLAAAARCSRAVPSRHLGGLDRVHGARSTASSDAALPKPALCPVAGVCLGLGSPGACGQVSRRVFGRAWGQCSGGVWVRARAGRPGRQMDSSSASILHPFSPRQTPSDFHKSKRHTV